MKVMFFAAALLLAPCAVRAQVSLNLPQREILLAQAPAAAPTAIPAQAPALPVPAPVATSAPQLDLYPLGHPFGSSKQWQFGLENNPVPGACVQRELHDGQWNVGPCYDIFVLDRNNVRVAQIGAYAVFNAEHGNGQYGLRAGVYLGAVAKNLLADAPKDITFIESLSGWQPPKFLQYVDQVTTVEASVGYRPWHNAQVQGNLGYGVMCKVGIPLPALQQIQAATGF